MLCVWLVVIFWLFIFLVKGGNDWWKCVVLFFCDFSFKVILFYDNVLNEVYIICKCNWIDGVWSRFLILYKME